MSNIPKDYLQKEYEFRLTYLTSHLGRMWTRFNFFLTINTALFAFAVNQTSQEVFLLAGMLGILVCLLWNQFAATDNYLVDVYRKQVAHAYFLLTQDASFDTLRNSPPFNHLKTWTYTGDISPEYFDPTDGRVKQIAQGFFQRRIPWLSATELGVVMSALYVLAWLGLLIVKIY